jgi:hypothetical protein
MMTASIAPTGAAIGLRIGWIAVAIISMNASISAVTASTIVSTIAATESTGALTGHRIELPTTAMIARRVDWIVEVMLSTRGSTGAVTESIASWTAAEIAPIDISIDVETGLTAASSDVRDDGRPLRAKP